jgi:hypothetical protein
MGSSSITEIKSCFVRSASCKPKDAASAYSCAAQPEAASPTSITAWAVLQILEIKSCSGISASGKLKKE